MASLRIAADTRVASAMSEFRIENCFLHDTANPTFPDPAKNEGRAHIDYRNMGWAVFIDGFDSPGPVRLKNLTVRNCVGLDVRMRGLERQWARTSTGTTEGSRTRMSTPPTRPPARSSGGNLGAFEDRLHETPGCRVRNGLSGPINPPNNRSAGQITRGAMDTGDAMFREWDLYDRIGRANYMRHREVSTVLRDALRQRSEPLRILDLGCGDGWMSDQVLSGTLVAEYVGVDLSESALDRLSRRPCPGTRPWSARRKLVCGDVAGEVRGLPDHGFDVILAGYVLHHLPTAAKSPVLDDVVRLLDSGGWLLWTDLARSADESREELIQRLADDIDANWSALEPDERKSAIRHMQNFDFPESESWMIDQIENRGVAFSRWLFRDEFYGTLLFQKPT